ncbi:hypothetical protein Pmani_016390 [Petrolisthes manimaculis]|uniref:Uncharacterized protein n=1 Tax=Petrolisthes manimaculis TaxID=1843537 RepID=A0AAE1PQE9_9EUCA|nr:hypothetical protein Pmani_016390 [Petrolisthes manimaculis]
MPAPLALPAPVIFAACPICPCRTSRRACPAPPHLATLSAPVAAPRTLRLTSSSRRRRDGSWPQPQRPFTVHCCCHYHHVATITPIPIRETGGGNRKACTRPASRERINYHIRHSGLGDGRGLGLVTCLALGCLTWPGLTFACQPSFALLSVVLFTMSTGDVALCRHQFSRGMAFYSTLEGASIRHLSQHFKIYDSMQPLNSAARYTNHHKTPNIILHLKPHDI